MGIRRQHAFKPVWQIVWIICFYVLSLNYTVAGENLTNTQPVEKTVLVLGDSLSAAFGIDKRKGWVQILSDKYAGQISFVNASVSGDTTSGGRYRLPKALEQHQPALVIIELGGNDGLRGTPVKLIQANLEAMIQTAEEAGAEVMLLGMRIPPNYGQHYTELFAGVYPKIANAENLFFVPFFLDGVAGIAGMMQEDGIHPTEKAQSIMAEHVDSVLRDWLADKQ